MNLTKTQLVHKICPYLKGSLECNQCPEYHTDIDGDEVQLMCYALAEEVVNIVQTGNPFGREEVND